MVDEALPPPPEGYDPVTEEPASPMLVAINMTFVEWRDGYARIEGPIAPPAVNRSGIVHGGAMATLIDAASGYAGCWCPYPGRTRRAFTLSLTTQFMAGRRDGLLITEARVTGGGASVFFTEAAVRHEDGELLATGVGTFRRHSASRSLYGEPRPSA